LPADQLEKTFSFFNPSTQEIAKQTEAMLGSIGAQIPLRMKEAVGLQTLVFMIEIFWRTMSMMLLGMLLYKKGILSAENSNAYYMKMMTIGFVVGLIVSGFGLYQAYALEWNGAYVMNVGANYKFVSGVSMALAYIGMLMWFYKKGILKPLQSRLQSAGRMAFTNYIGMSVICGLIFYGHGLGLFGSLDRLQQFLVVIAIWVLMLVVSPLVLKTYRFGPLEWFWRKLTYLTFKKSA
jgi:uncharacterized protein